LFEVEDGRFRFRLAGRFIVEAYGVEPRGKFLDELLPPDRAELALKAYRLVVDRRRPVLAQSEMITPRGFCFPLTRLLLPLRGRNADVGFVLAGLSIERWVDRDVSALGPATSTTAGKILIEILEDRAMIPA
jgi:hypothetical protein